VVNGFPVPPRPGIRPLVIDPWLVASGCAPGSPIVGPGAYHRPTCKLVAGRDLRKMTIEQAEAANLEPCRTCAPGGGRSAADAASPGPASGTRGR